MIDLLSTQLQETGMATAAGDGGHELLTAAADQIGARVRISQLGRRYFAHVLEECDCGEAGDHQCPLD